MKNLNRIIAVVVGLLFMFSGLIKLNDPVGTEIKLEEYFEVFKADTDEMGLASYSVVWEFFEPRSLSLAVLLSVLEVAWGFSLIFFIRPRLILSLLFLMVVFFGFLTFYSAYYDKVTDCGCFGDAIKLTPWQSFYKDVILTVLIFILLVQSFVNKQAVPDTNIRALNIASFLVYIGAFVLAIYSIYNLPIIDFRAYKIGKSIPEEMKPKGEIKTQDEYVFTKLTTGEDEKSTTWDAKYQDTTQYKYKSFESVVLNPEVLPAITDYAVKDVDGNDVTESTFQGKKLLVIIPDVQRSEPSAYEKVKALAYEFENKENSPELMILTATASDIFAGFVQQEGITVPYYFVDKTVLKTMVRSSPGFILLEDGVVKNKWHHNNAPEASEL